MPSTTIPQYYLSRHMPSFLWRLLPIYFLCALGQAIASNPVNFAWDRSPEPDVIGYRFYYGTASGAYENSVNVGNNTELVLSSLPSSTIFYAVVSALSSSSLESLPSMEIVFETSPNSEVVSGEILLLTVNDAGDVLLQRKGGSTEILTVEYSGNLIQWTILGTLPLQDGSGTLKDAGAFRGLGRRFYRAVVK